MADLTVTPADVAPVEIVEQVTAPANEAINAGQPVRFDTTTGRLALANGTTAAEARAIGIALNTVLTGEPLTAVRRGVIDVGDALDALAFDAPVYVSDTDGTLGGADTDATVDVIVGRVEPAFGNTTPDKVLRVAL